MNQPPIIQLLTPTDFDRDFMLQAQATNLRWCESFGASLPLVAGVPVGLALTYDLIQLLNRSTTEQILNALQSLREQGQILPGEVARGIFNESASQFEMVEVIP